MQIIVLFIGLGIILGVEVLLWVVFWRQAAALQFPHEYDISSLRFFSRFRVGAVIIVHTLFLLAAFAAAILFLWS